MCPVSMSSVQRQRVWAAVQAAGMIWSATEAWADLVMVV